VKLPDPYSLICGPSKLKKILFDPIDLHSNILLSTLKGRIFNKDLGRGESNNFLVNCDRGSSRFVFMVPCTSEVETRFAQQLIENLFWKSSPVFNNVR
jgi:hypothetical protein